MPIENIDYRENPQNRLKTFPHVIFEMISEIKQPGKSKQQQQNQQSSTCKIKGANTPIFPLKKKKNLISRKTDRKNERLNARGHKRIQDGMEIINTPKTRRKWDCFRFQLQPASLARKTAD